VSQFVCSSIIKLSWVGSICSRTLESCTGWRVYRPHVWCDESLCRGSIDKPEFWGEPCEILAPTHHEACDIVRSRLDIFPLPKAEIRASINHGCETTLCTHAKFSHVISRRKPAVLGRCMRVTHQCENYRPMKSPEEAPAKTETRDRSGRARP
jgi:hypothetical protein